MKKPNYLYQDSESVYKRVSQDVFDGISPLPHWVKIPEGSECFVLWEGEKNTFYKDNFNLVTTEGGTCWTPCGWEGENKIKENGGKLVWCEEGFENLKHPKSELKSVGVDLSKYAHLNDETTGCTETVSCTENTLFNPLDTQEGGGHYKGKSIQPIQYTNANNLNFQQGNIIKYITRHKEKNGIEDLAKVVHYALLEALFVYGEEGSTQLKEKVLKILGK